jgi:hypothetical protein
MLRRVLTAYLAFLVAAAPCLCCCTAAKAIAAAPAEPAKPKTTCCCHEVAPEPESTPTNKPSAPQEPENCPCREHAAKAVIAAAGDSLLLQDQTGGTLFPPALLAIGNDLVSLDGAGVPPFLKQSEPFLSAVDLLRLHHRLRC